MNDMFRMPGSIPPESEVPDTQRDTSPPTLPGDADDRPTELPNGPLTLRPSQRPTPLEPVSSPGRYHGEPTEEHVLESETRKLRVE